MAKKKYRTGKLKYGSVSALMLAMVLAALIALNIGAYTLEKKKGWSVDLSFNGILSQSEETKTVLGQLEDPVEIYALIRKSNESEPALSQLMELLDRYAAASDKITWKQTDPALNPTLLNRFTTDSVMPQENNLIVWCEKTGRFRIVGGQELMGQELDMETGDYSYSILTYENAVTSAIAYVIKDRIPQAVILQGHNEYDPDTLENFRELLEANQYTVIYQSLKDSAYTPDPEDLLIFFCPTKDLTEAEKNKLTEFAAKGGCFLFVCEYDDPLKNMNNYLSLLRLYGFIPLEGIVTADEAADGTYYKAETNYINTLIPEMCPTDLTIGLINTGADFLLLDGARAFEEPEEGDRSLYAAIVLRSGETSYLKDINALTTDKSPEDRSGDFPLALQAYRVTTDGYVSRAFIIGDSAVLTSKQLYSYTYSMQFTVKIMDYLLKTDASGLQIAPKEAVRPGLKTASSGLGSVLLVALPLAVLFAALLILGPRRSR